MSRPPSSFRWRSPALKLLLHALAVTNYGYFRDELYYIACSKHLAWGYVDQPPFSIAVLAARARGARRLARGRCGCCRRSPARPRSCSSASSRETSAAAAFAQALACLCAVLAPVLAGRRPLLQHERLRHVLLVAVGVVAAARARPGTAAHWVALGVVLGLGLLNKTSMLWFGGGAAVGLARHPPSPAVRRRALGGRRHRRRRIRPTRRLAVAERLAHARVHAERGRPEDGPDGDRGLLGAAAARHEPGRRRRCG